MDGFATLILSSLLKAKFLERLRNGDVVLGDGSYTITLEKRGYVLTNAWTPEAAVEHPDAVRNLAMEFARAGGDVTQTYTFFSDDKRLREWHGPGIPTVRSKRHFTFLFLLFYVRFSVKKSTIPLVKSPRVSLKKRAQSLPEALP